MIIPKIVKFGGLTYKVILTENLDVGENWGRTDMGKQQIHLNKSAHPEKQMQTLIHELMHLAYSATAHILTEEQQEQIIKPWIINLFSILKQNNLLK